MQNRTKSANKAQGDNPFFATLMLPRLKGVGERYTKTWTLEQIRDHIAKRSDAKERERDAAIAAFGAGQKGTGSPLEIYKKSLASCTFSALQFVDLHRQIVNISPYSGLAAIDLDYMETEHVTAAYDALIEQPWVVMAYISPSKAGVKIIVRLAKAAVAESEYKWMYRDAAKRVSECAGHEWDKSTTNGDRLTFLPHDPHVYLNLEATALPEPEPEPEPKPRPRPKLDSSCYRDYADREQRTCSAIDLLPPYTPGTGTRNRALAVGWGISDFTNGSERVRQHWQRKLEADGRDDGDGLWRMRDWQDHASDDSAGVFLAECKAHGIRVLPEKSSKRKNEANGASIEPRTDGYSFGALVHLSDGKNQPMPRREGRASANAAPLDTSGLPIEPPPFPQALEGFLENDDDDDTPMTALKAEELLDSITSEWAQIELIVRHKRTRQRLIRVNGSGPTKVRLFDGLGTWFELSTKRGIGDGDAWVRRHLRSVMKDFLSECTNVGKTVAAKKKVQRAISGRRISEIAKVLADATLDFQLGDAVHSQELNQLRRDGRVLAPAFGDQGGALDLAAGHDAPLITPEEMRPHLITLTDWRAKAVSVIAKESPVVQLVDRFVHERYKELIARSGCWMTDTSKRIDVVISEVSGSGKTTFATILERALPGYCEGIESTKAFASTRFNPAAEVLTKRRIVVIDEIDKFAKDITGGHMNTMTGDMLSVELKGQDVVQKMRLGTLVMFGGGYPKIDMDAQGVADRLKWILIMEDIEPMTSKDRDLLLSQEALNRWREYLYKAAYDATQLEDPWIATEEARASDHELFKIRTRHWLVQRIMERVIPSKDFGMSWDQFKEIVKAGDEESTLTDKEISTALHKAFPTIKKRQIPMGTAKPWMWPLEKQASLDF